MDQAKQMSLSSPGFSLYYATYSDNFGMLSMDLVIRLIEIVAWPVTALLLIWFARKEIRLLVPLIQRIKYKDVEIDFSKQLSQVTKDVDEYVDKSKTIESKDDIDADRVLSLAEINPPSAVIEAWKELERTAREKVRQLVPEGETYREPFRRPIDYLDYKGALVPSVASAARDLRSLRNTAAHVGAGDISREDAIQYVTVANQIRVQIEAISELPAVKLTALTLLILELNHLIDSRKYDDLTIDEVYDWIEEEKIIPLLKKRTEGDSDLSLYGKEGPYSNFSVFYHEQMKQLAGGYAGEHRRKWGVENLGLCLLLAWTNELIQQGAGWHPRKT